MSEYTVSVTFSIEAEDTDEAWDRVDHAIGDIPPTVGIEDVETQEVESDV